MYTSNNLAWLTAQAFRKFNAIFDLKLWMRLRGVVEMVGFSGNSEMSGTTILCRSLWRRKPGKDGNDGDVVGRVEDMTAVCMRYGREDRHVLILALSRSV